MDEKGKLIHVGEYLPPHKKKRLLFLRELKPHHFVWFEEDEKETDVTGASIEEAIRHANKAWKLMSFRTIKCGFRYTLPERDEHGMNALFHQMAASQESSSGDYFDEELGHPCFVQAASREALNLWKELKLANRL